MSEQAARKPEALKGAVRPHQPGQAEFRAIVAEDIQWKPFAAFPSGARLAVLVGQPSEQGPYMVRVKVPHGVKLMPHRHPRTVFTRSFPEFSTSALAMNSMLGSCLRTRPEL